MKVKYLSEISYLQKRLQNRISLSCSKNIYPIADKTTSVASKIRPERDVKVRQLVAIESTMDGKLTRSERLTNKYSKCRKRKSGVDKSYPSVYVFCSLSPRENRGLSKENAQLLNVYKDSVQPRKVRALIAGQIYCNHFEVTGDLCQHWNFDREVCKMKFDGAVSLASIWRVHDATVCLSQTNFFLSVKIKFCIFRVYVKGFKNTEAPVERLQIVGDDYGVLWMAEVQSYPDITKKRASI